MHNKQKVLITIISTLLVVGGITSGTEDLRKRDDSHMNDVTIKFRVLKGVYEPNEPVPLIVAIANHRSEPIYVYGKDPELLDRRHAWVTDANGVEMPCDKLPSRLVVPPDHYMNIDGNEVKVAPISRIEPHDVAICWMADGLKPYHGHLPEGKYYLQMNDYLIVHEIDKIIKRNDTDHQLWYKPDTTSITRCFHPVKSKIKIEIRKKSEDKQIPEREIVKPEQDVVAQSRFAWPTFIGGTILGLIVPCAVLLMRKKA